MIPVVRVVRADHVNGRGRFWRENKAGYTSRIEEAGLYTPSADPTVEHETWFEAPLWVFRDEVARTIASVEAEIAALRERVNRLRSWSGHVLCSGPPDAVGSWVPGEYWHSMIPVCESPATEGGPSGDGGSSCDAAPVLVPLAFCPYRSRESLACTEPAP